MRPSGEIANAASVQVDGTLLNMGGEGFASRRPYLVVCTAPEFTHPQLLLFIIGDLGPTVLHVLTVLDPGLRNVITIDAVVFDAIRDTGTFSTLDLKRSKHDENYQLPCQATQSPSQHLPQCCSRCHRTLMQAITNPTPTPPPPVSGTLASTDYSSCSFLCSIVVIPSRNRLLSAATSTLHPQSVTSQGSGSGYIDKSLSLLLTISLAIASVIILIVVFVMSRHVRRSCRGDSLLGYDTYLPWLVTRGRAQPFWQHGEHCAAWSRGLEDNAPQSGFVARFGVTQSAGLSSRYVTTPSMIKTPTDSSGSIPNGGGDEHSQHPKDMI